VDRTGQRVPGDAVLDIGPQRYVVFMKIALHAIGLLIVLLDAAYLSSSETLDRAVIYGACLGGMYALNDLRLLVSRDRRVVVRNPVLVRSFSLTAVVGVDVSQNAVRLRVRGWPSAFTVSATGGALRFGANSRVRDLAAALAALVEDAQRATEDVDTPPWRTLKTSWLAYVAEMTVVYLGLAVLSSWLFG
jgi:hypothetical protein